MDFFHIVFYQPLYNALIWFYDVLPGGDIGFAIILVTIIVKGFLFPLTFKTLKSQKEMTEIQPKINEIKEKYADDKEKMAQELMSIYKEHNVNPFGSCLPLLIQLPIFISLFRVLRNVTGTIDADILYSFVSNPETINSMFLGLIDLSVASIPLAILAAIAQYFQVKQTMRRRVPKPVRKESGAMDEDMSARMNKMMLYFMPGLTLLMGTTSLPGGIMLYWLATTILTLILYKIFLTDKKLEIKVKE